MTNPHEPPHREDIFDEAEDQVLSAKEVVRGMLGYLHRLPQAPESTHLLRECQRAQGHLARSIEMFRMLRSPEHRN
jgi:hypothetical protein